MDALLSMRRRRFVAALGAGVLGSGCAARRAPTLDLAGTAMGSTWSVRIAGHESASPAFEAAARAAVAGAIDAVESRMSSFDAASELARFNRHAATAPFALSPETLTVLARARAIAAESGGAFDITIAPLVGAWGFGAQAATRAAMPSAAQLAAPIGWRRLALDAGAQTARKSHPALRLDLSGIAKGHAVDRAALALEALGVERYLVEAGGEIRTRGLNAEGRPWQIAIEEPDAWPQRARRIVPLTGLSIATSGDYRNFYERGGQRIHHEIDPATRAPAAHALASASVVHANCTDADAWSTALFVLGPARGLALAREMNLAALFVVREAGGALRDIASPAFVALPAA